MLRLLTPLLLSLGLVLAAGAPESYAGVGTKSAKTAKAKRQPKRKTGAERRALDARRARAFLKPQRVSGYRVRLASRRYFKRLGLRGYGLQGRAKKKAMVDQMIEVRRFIGQLAYHLDGTPNRYFQEVVLVPRKILGDDMRLEGGTLLIGVEVGLLRGRVKVRDAFALRRSWARGEAWEKGSMFRKYWPVLDPAGTRRKAARTLLRELRGGFSGSLTALPRRREQLRKGLRELILESAAGSENAATAKLRDRALGVIAGASQKQLAGIARRWQSHAEDADNLADAAEAAARTQYISNWDIDIDNGDGGFVFANMKRIKIGVGRMGRFLDKPAQASETRIRIRQDRGIIVQPNDDVHVEVDATEIARAAIRALRLDSLEKALDAEAP